MNLGVSQLLTFIQNAFFSVTIPFSRSGSGCKDSWAGGEERFLLFFEGKIETEGEQRVDLWSWVNPRVSLSDVHAGFPIPAPQLLQIKVKKSKSGEDLMFYPPGSNPAPGPGIGAAGGKFQRWNEKDVPAGAGSL